MHVRVDNNIEIFDGTILLSFKLEKYVQLPDSASVRPAYIVWFVTSSVIKRNGQLLVVAVRTVDDVKVGIDILVVFDVVLGFELLA